MKRSALAAILVLSLASWNSTLRVSAQGAAGEPIAGGAAEKDARFLLPPDPDQAEPAWTEAERRRGFVVYTDHYMRPMYRHQKPRRDQIVDRVSAELARAEYEPVQLGVYAIASASPVRGVSVTVDTDLPVEVRRMETRINRPASPLLKQFGGVETPHILRPGAVADAIAPGTTATFWLTFQALPDAVPGEHSATVRVTAAEGGTAAELAVLVRVLPFELPPADIAFGMYFYRVMKRMNPLAEVIQRDHAAHGMRSSTLYVQEPIRFVTDDTSPEGRLEFPKAYEARVRERLERGMYDPNIPIMLMDYQLINYHSGRLNDSLSATEKQTVARHYQAYTRAHGFPEFLAYVQDEPSLDQPPSYRNWVAGWKKTPMRTVAAMSGEAAAALGYLHDVWVVHAGQITPEMVREAWRQGAEVWAYTFSMAFHNVLANRYMAGLYTWGLGLRGNYHWIYVHRSDNFNDLGADGPDPVVCWEGRREGVDDYRYLMLLERLVADAGPDNEAAAAARTWLDELRNGIDRQLFHGFEGWMRNDGWFAYPAPELELADYDRIRRRAAEYALQLGAASLDRFAPLPYVRSRAPKWEAAPFENASVQTCVDALSRTDPHVRRSAAAALALRGSAAQRAGPALLRLLADPQARLVALRALRGLELTGNDASRACQALEPLLQDPDGFVRMNAALCLGGLGDCALPGLRIALRDPDASVVKIAGHALAETGSAGAAAVPELIPMIRNRRSAVQRSAFRAIEGIGPDAAAAVPALVEYVESKKGAAPYAARALAAIGPAAAGAVPVLEKHLGTDKWYFAWTRYALFRIRGHVADLEAILDLIRNGERRHTPHHAAEALERLGAEGAELAPAVRAFLDENPEDFVNKLKEPAKRLQNFLEAVEAADAAAR